MDKENIFSIMALSTLEIFIMELYGVIARYNTPKMEISSNMKDKLMKESIMVSELSTIPTESYLKVISWMAPKMVMGYSFTEKININVFI